jgi:CMP-N-acetylneuraminic acid synthetase
MSPSAPVDRVVCVIPARGGSKGVRGKNLRNVGGVPLVARAVHAALAAPSLDRVIVSTDDDDIAAVARAAGASVVRRPDDLSGDSASSESALLHALDSLESDPEILVFIQATSPFISPSDLDLAVDRVRNGSFDSVFSARPTHAFLWREGDRGAWGVNHDSSHRLRRQEREPEFQETGAFYAFKVPEFRAAGFRFFGRIGVVPVPELTAIEIDSEDDLTLARALAPLLDARQPVGGHPGTHLGDAHPDDDLVRLLASPFATVPTNTQELR